MILADCNVGDTVIHGKRSDLNEGAGGAKVLIKGVGKYTTVLGTGCPGYKVVPNAGSRSAVWIEKDIRHFNRDLGEYGEYEILRGDDVVQPGTLMTVTEYNAKAKAAQAVRRASEAHEAIGSQLLRDLRDVLAPHVAKLTTEPSIRAPWSWHRREADPIKLTVTATITHETVASLPAKARREAVRLLDAYGEWKQIKNPGTC